MYLLDAQEMQISEHFSYSVLVQVGPWLRLV